MKQIVVLDTWINDTNTGNRIIMDAVLKELRDIFPSDFFYQVPAMEYLYFGRKLVRGADYVFLGGANLLSSNMNNRRTCGWRLHFKDMLWLRDVILMGLGWWQYQPFPPNLYTKTLLNMVLRKDCFHEVRDSYTLNHLKILGFNVLNAGCPSIWRLSAEHCADIPQSKAENALLSFTSYKQNPEDDKLLFDIVEKNYSTVFFWPQNYIDLKYAKTICGNRLVFVDPSLEALDHLLQGEALDHVGTRLHCGIRALQHKQRTLIIAVDNRATEMGRDFNLPVVQRKDVASKLEKKINNIWKTDVMIDQSAINIWKSQFNEDRQTSGSSAPELSGLRSAYQKVIPGIARKAIGKAVNKVLFKNI